MPVWLAFCSCHVEGFILDLRTRVWTFSLIKDSIATKNQGYNLGALCDTTLSSILAMWIAIPRFHVQVFSWKDVSLNSTIYSKKKCHWEAAKKRFSGLIWSLKKDTYCLQSLCYPVIWFLFFQIPFVKTGEEDPMHQWVRYYLAQSEYQSDLNQW